MSEPTKTPLPSISVARHGETEWSLSGRHTGRAEIPLTERGEQDAQCLGRRLREMGFADVWTSPLGRARHTATLAGFDDAKVDPDLVEWDYGEIEGLTTATYWERRPGWDLFRDGCAGGESVAEIAARADRVIDRLRSVDRDVLLFSHGHFLRVLAARWVGLGAEHAAAFFLTTSALGALGYEHARSRPAIRLWNDTGHLFPGSH